MTTPSTDPSASARASAPTAFDLAMMELACAQAERARGRTSPNPLVGAVVVDESGPEPKVLSTGYHARLGGPHAEVAALQPLGGKAEGKTIYVTLEPCNHVGRTGNCTEALLAAGVRRVVIGIRDPNPRVKGGGLQRLRDAGVLVEAGVLEAACRRQNRGYLHWLETGRPHMILKAAVSLDGRLAPDEARRGAGPFWLTGGPARLRAHEMRDAADAILVGAGTVLADDPQLTVRLPPEQRRDDRQPLRVVLDGALRVPPTAKLCGPGTLIVTSTAAAEQRPDQVRALTATGAEVVALEAALDSSVNRAKLPVSAWPSDLDVAVLRGTVRPTDLDLAAVAGLLGRRDLLMVLCEGGGGLHGGLLGAGLYQEAALFVAPVLLGDRGVPLLRGASAPCWLTDASSEALGSDVLIRGFIHERPSAPLRAIDSAQPQPRPTEDHVHRAG